MYLFAFLALCGMAATITACKKSRMNKETTSEADNSTAESMFDDVGKTTDQVADDENLDGSQKTGAPAEYLFASTTCTPVITINPPAWDTATGQWNPTFPKTLTIDFGTAGCLGADGKTRKGKIIVTTTGKYRDAGTVITTTLDNFYVSDNGTDFYHIEGTRTVTNQGNYTFSVVVSGAKITHPDGTFLTWESTRTRTWIEGMNTGFLSLKSDSTCCMWWTGILDDVYSVTGSGSGVNRDGIAFTVTVTEALRVQFCGYKVEVTDGVVEIQPDGLKKRTVDFGDGTCDNSATVSVGNKTKTIQLHG